MLYRRHLRRKARRTLGELMALLPLAAFLPIIAVDPRLLPVQLNLADGNYVDSNMATVLVLAGICPMCAVLGYLTPGLIDQYAGGHPAAAGKAYGINVVGCILGPLCASYLLLPHMSERSALVILAAPLLCLGFLCCKTLPAWQRMAAAVGAGAALLWSLFFANDFEGLLKKREVRTVVRRDYAASVISFGEGFNRMLLVNGVGMTQLTPEPKFMVHLPMAFHKGRPESVLVICFGMGTSFRSALSWDARTTAVELVPSVVDAFGFYHKDAASVLANTKGRIVIDDGRRYLKRTREKYDVIVVDPPPPPEAAGSSLLYSREFCELAREHLNPNGILQIWHPGGMLATVQAAVRSFDESFPYVRCFDGVQGWGAHLLGSMQPIEPATDAELIARMPAKARQDLTEWMPVKRYPALSAYLKEVTSMEEPVPRVLNPNLQFQITDDQPFNEYYLLRRWRVYAP
jgi:spermidine synthase